MALEPRMMFDGAVAATTAEVTDTPPAADATDVQPSATDTQAASDSLAATPAGTSDNRQEVVFVDSQVKDYQQLVGGLKPGTEVVVLDASKDGLQQMADYLDGRSGIDAIHILSHGDVGKVQLGNDWLEDGDLASRNELLDAIGQSLDSGGDILLYGCRVGADGEGQGFIDGLAAATGADVAASSDLTGAAGMGGDWVLEVSQGEVEAAALDLTDYSGLLAAFADDLTSANGISGVTTFTRTLGGVSYTFTFTSDGDGGDFAWENINGAGGSASINMLSFDATNAVERVTIARTDGQDFTFSSIFIDNASGGTTNVRGFLDGVAVGANQAMAVGTSGTLTFGSLRVDQVQITSTDFFGTNFDNFSGDTDPPLIAPSLSATGSNPSFTENGSAVDLFSSVTADTHDSGQSFSGMTLSVTNVSNGASELLNIGGSDIALNNGNSGTIAGIGNYSVSVAGSTAIVTLSGMSRTNIQMGTLVDGITYRNTSDSPGGTSRAVTITSVTDSGGSNNSASPNITSTVAVTPVNDAPSLAPANDTAFYTENGAGAVLSSTLTISDPDSANFQGATVTISDFRTGDVLSVGTPGGFATSFNSATGVLTLTGPGTLAALQTALRSVSYSSTSDDPTFGGTDGTRQINFTVTDSNGVASGNATSQVAITSVNDAPTLSGGPYAWAGTSEDATSTAVTVSSLLGGLTASDPDSSSVGIALTASSGNGTWQYSTDGLTWSGIGSVAGNAALLLSASSQLRYVPNAQNGETATLTLRAWDQTSGTASTNGTRSTADTTTNGGSTAFSSGTALATLTVSSINDAPVLTPVAPTLTGLTDGDVNNPGQLVASFAGGTIGDVDSGAVSGIAITGLNAGNGTWQYSLDGGGSWSNVGSVADSAALLLRSTDRVRFVPDGINGTSASLTYRAWDQSGATAGQQGTKVDASATGGATAFSSASDTASITVTAIDDAPVVTTSGGSAAFIEGDNVASTPMVIDPGITLSDADSSLLQSATVTIVGGFQSGQDVLAFSSNPATMGDITGSYNSATGVLTLTSAGGASAAQWQAALRVVTYGNSSDTPATATRTIGFAVSDGNSFSATANRTVTVATTNDAPIVTVPGSITVSEDVATAITGISFSDLDAGGGSVTVTLSVPSGSLGATSGGGVTVGGTASALTLTGSISNINAFIAGGQVSFQTAPNSTSSITLTASIDDGGNTGGAAGSDSDNVTLTMTPVNDAPVVNAPASINVTEDIPQALTGISFGDIDAGSGVVSVQFSVAPGSGSLSASSGAGVTVLGSGTGTLSLSGTLPDINAFLASGAVSYTTASNATSNVVLSLSIDDGGNTGTGGSQTGSTSLTLVVSAVNDAPVNSVPGSQTVLENGNLVFSTGNGNAVSIADVDAGGGTVQVTLTASNGLITLGSISGLVFSVGSGSGDGTMTFDGTVSAINNALAGLSFTPTSGYHGPASLQITSNDLGLSGSGGNQTDSDTILIDVDQPNPSITSVAGASPDGGYKVGDTVSVSVTFDQAVTVSGGVPTLLLETGSTDRVATYVSGSGSNTLTFSYTVQAGDLSADLNYQSTTALALNGATIRSAANDDAILTLPALAGGNSLAGQSAIVIDGIAPTVASVGVPANGTYVAGQNLDFTVNLSEAVTVDTSGGIPRLAVILDGGGTVFANYLSGSGTTALVFRLTVATGQFDTNGISVGSILQANGATLRDAVGNDADTTLNNVASTTGVRVDAVAPTVSSVSVPPAVRYNAGDVLTFAVNASEAVLVTGTPRLALDIGGSTVFANYVSGSGTSTLVFQYSVQAGDNDADGIVVSSLASNGGALRDAAGNDLNLTLNAIGDTSGVLVDTIAPGPSGIVTLDPSPTNAGSVRFSVTFSEDVTGVDPADFTLVTTGTVGGSLASIVQVDPRTYRLTVSGLSGTGTLGLDLNGAGTGIVDLAGNAISGGLAGALYSLDLDAPTVTSVSVPADGIYVAGQNLDFTVNLSEAVTVDTSGGTPRIAVTLDGGGTVFADYLSGSGSTALVFRLTVASGQFDSNGISVGSAIQANGATLRDGLGNDADTTLNNVASTAGVQVDAVAPGVASVSVPTWLQYRAGDLLTFVVNASEAVFVNGAPRLALDIGGSTVFADYLSGSGSSALVFQYRVQPGENDANGLTVTGLASNGATLRDAAGNDMDLTLNNVGDTRGVAIDTRAPNASGIVRVDASPTNAGSVRYTVTFDEDVNGVDLSDFSLVTTGTASGSLANLVQVNARTYTVTVDGLSGTGTLGLDLNASGTGIIDGARNPVSGGLVGDLYSLDRDAPLITRVDVPANGTYVAGQHLDFTVNFSEALTVDTSGGSPRLAVTLDGGGTVFADYLGGSGSSALVFRLTVASGQFDSNGISVGSAILANGATLRDAVGNDADTSLNNLASTAGVRVDAVVPRVASVGVPVGLSYNAGDVLTFVVNASEAVFVNGTPRLALDMGGSTVFADYVAGSGSGRLVFQYRVQPGDNDADGIAVSGLASNGGTLRDAAGNDLNLALNGVGDTHGVVVDTTAPSAIGLVRADASPTSARTLRFTLTFSEDVSGLDLDYLSLNTTGNAVGTLQSLEQVDARTYQVTVGNVAGNGSLGISLNSPGTGITDAAGNLLVGSLVGESYVLSQGEGDPQFRIESPLRIPDTPNAPIDMLLPGPPPPPFSSPLLPLPLFEVQTPGSGFPTLGSLFRHNGAVAPSFIAQVFAAGGVSDGDASANGFLGFGGGDAGVFGTSSLASFFNRDKPDDSSEMKLFDARLWRRSADAGQDAQGGVGAPTLGQQLQDIQDNQQRQVDELARALAQIQADPPQA
ncbi:DUF4347 domain-containing protein [Pseudomonas sp. CR3202]|uniref:DUF4347 domain-containing protein n=1 Tax=Pseudomonas sp. CR3202 TaxID=3351532 RepID=UPI003BF26652